MEILNFVGSICSILGLLITVFLTTQIISIRNSIIDKSKNEVTQKNNSVKNGDIAGGNIYK